MVKFNSETTLSESSLQEVNTIITNFDILIKGQESKGIRQK